MKFTTLSRTVAAGAASALAASALVGVTTAAAHAAPITNEYTCSSDSFGDFPMTLDSDIPLLVAVPEIAAGFDVPPTYLDVSNTVTVPTAVVDGLAGIGIERVEAPGFAGSFGPVAVGVTGVGADVADAVDNGDGFSSLTANGTNAAFEVPAAGSYDVVSPESIELVAKNGSGTVIAKVPCALSDGETAGSYATGVAVFKNDSTAKATGPSKAVKKGKVANVKVKVKAPNETPGGKVLLKKGSKTLDSGKLNKKGVVTLSTKALKVGNNKLTTIYQGDGFTNGSKATTTVKVKP